MTDGVYATALHPRRQWPLWLILILAAIWAGIIVRRGAPGMVATADWSALLTALMPPAMGALLVASLLRTVRPTPDVAQLEERLGMAHAAAETLDDLLQSIDTTLGSCAGRIGQLAAAASPQGEGLAATATWLATAAHDVRQSGIEADTIAARLVATLPDLERVHREIVTMGDRLATDTVSQLQVIDALLSSVQVRGDEVSAQSDVAISSINKQLADIDEHSRETTSRIAKRAYALDAAVDGASGRASGLLDSVALRIADQMAALDDRLAAARMELAAVGEQSAIVIGERLEQLHVTAESLSNLLAIAGTHSEALRHGLDTHLDALPARLERTRSDGQAAIDAIIARTIDLHAGLTSLREPFDTSAATIGALGERMDRLHAVAGSFDATLTAGLPRATEQLGRLEAGADALQARVTDLHAAITGGEAAARAVGVVVGDLRGEVAALGEADLRLVDDRMNATAIVMADIGRAIAAYAAQSAATKAAIEADLRAIGHRLTTTHDDGATQLAALSGHAEQVGETIDALVAPIDVARRRLDDVEAQVGHVGDATASLGQQLDGQLAATTAAFARMDDRGAALLAEIASLQAAMVEGDAAIAAVSSRFAAERAAFIAAAEMLGTEFDRMSGVLDALDTATGALAAGTATELGRTFERARALAEANAAGLRDLLAAIVADTERTLGDTGATIAASAFAEPIHRELRAIGAAADHAGDVAEAAALRVAGQVKAIGTKIDAVDAKVAELDTTLDVRARDTLSARSSRLIGMLQAASVDVARLLAVDVGEQAWTQYLQGDRSLFARRTVKLVDATTSDKIARHFAHDRDFHDEAAYYLDTFETLSRRLLSDPDGETLLATVVSSDIGKLYVALARGTGRWWPIAA